MSKSPVRHHDDCLRPLDDSHNVCPRRQTADSITDEQIRDVRKAMIGVPRKNAYHRSVIKDCDAALSGDRTCRESAALAWNRMQDGAR